MYLSSHTVFITNLQVLDATLKEITAALLESDVNVKLVASLRQKVKAKVKAALESADKSKDVNRKNLIQKVCFLRPSWYSIFRFHPPRLSLMS